MRTVTFSNRKALEILETKFVCVWRNIRPEQPFRAGLYDGERGARAVRALRPGDGSDNICALLCTTDEKVVHAVQGFLEAGDFVRELEFGVEAARLAQSEEGKVKLEKLYAQRAKDPGDLRGAARVLLAGNLSILARSPLPPLGSHLEPTRAGLR